MNKGSRQRNARKKPSMRGKAGAAEPPQGESEPVRQAVPVMHTRNRLVSMMLQNRGVLRLICAPRGYGKTSLAREYAKRMFAGKTVTWVDASTPSFLADLDRGQLQGFAEMRIEQPGLLVIDDIPWLHEQRAMILSRRIDAALYRGVEVVATTLPSCDCLGALQPERVLVRACDLELTEQDCLEAQEDQGPRSRARAARMWQRARVEPFGRVPSVAWGDSGEARRKVMEWFFSEKLPIGTVRAAFALLLLGSGALADLASVGAEAREEEARMFARDYPFLCVDLSQGRFAAPKCPLEELRAAMEASGMAGLFGPQSGLFMGKVLGVLMGRGDLQRVEEALGVFCTDAQCAQWLLDSGWALLDRGEAELVDALLGRCPDAVFEDSAPLQVLRAWTSGLMGDPRESGYYAQAVLRNGEDGSCGDDEAGQATGALAYLALAAFGEGGASIYGKGQFSQGCAPVSASGFIASVTDLCSAEEISRAFGHDERDGHATGRSPEADENRARALSALFTGCAERLKGDSFYRLAFHLLCSVGSDLLKPVVQAVGCEIVVHARHPRKGIPLTLTGALVVRDLWRAGFFGVMGTRHGGHDAKLLEEAGMLIRKTTALSSGEQPDVPWDIETRFRERPRDKKKAKTERDEVPLVRVRLFGSFEVTVGDRYVKDTEWRKKSRMLLILVVLSQGRDISRDSLFEQLWPGMSRVRALDNFYSAWSTACNILGDGPYLERTGSFCRVNPRYLISDVSEFEQLTRRLLTEHPDTNALLDIYARIESLYRGGLVPSETENETINAQRERYEATYVDAMVSAAECSLRANDARLALWFARKAREIGPQREDVYQILIRAQVAAGQRCSAIRSYFECRQYLRDELGLDPSGEIQDLYNRLINVDPTLLKLEPSSFQHQ